ncbi:SRPBCC family protein [Flagellimonas meridianipacifica]|nr:SRPBCC domain-containing protein [Allomuricauda pacifica]
MNIGNKTLQDYRKSVLVNASQERVFASVTQQVDAWWSEVDEQPNELGKIFKITFGGKSYWRFKVIELSANEHVTWECIESHQDHNIKGMDEEWLGSRLHWELTSDAEGTIVDFLHQGLVPHAVCYGVCSSAWDFYITESLKSYVETGRGMPTEM